MKNTYCLILIFALAISTTSCLEFLEPLSGSNQKTLVPGLNIPVSDESEFASSLQGIQTGGDVSSDIFSILGPLAGLSEMSISGFSLKSYSIGDIQNSLTKLGEHDPSGGHYTQIVDNLSTNGVTKIYFKDASDNTIYLDLKWAAYYGNQPVYTYDTRDINSAKTDVVSSTTTIDTEYLPGPWRKFSDGQPIDPVNDNWLEVYSSDFEVFDSLPDRIGDFLKSQLLSYAKMRIIVNAQQSDRIIEMNYTVTMGADFVPTDENFVEQKGSGKITFTKGTEVTEDDLVLNITKYELRIGANGPIGGTVETSRSDGFSTKMTYSSDGSSYGTVYKDNKQIATVSINPDGTGTYTDSSGKTYPIS